MWQGILHGRYRNIYWSKKHVVRERWHEIFYVAIICVGGGRKYYMLSYNIHLSQKTTYGTKSFECTIKDQNF